MWHGRPSKQRVRLGTREYRDGCRYTATNSGSDSDTTNNSDAMRPVNANANAYRNDSSKPNTHAKLAWVAYAYCYDTAITDAYALNTRIAYSTATDTHADAEGDTKASADSVSSAVSA